MSKASIAHISIPAREPRLTADRLTADRLAPIVDGEVFEFPVVPGAFIIVARDGSGLALEVVPERTQHHQGKGEPDPRGASTGPRTQPWEVQILVDGQAPGPLAMHAAITTPLTAADVLDIGRQAGWRALACERGGVFGVVELWVDNRFMLELLPAEAVRYREFMRPEVCGTLFGAPLSKTHMAA